MALNLTTAVSTPAVSAGGSDSDEQDLISLATTQKIEDILYCGVVPVVVLVGLVFNVMSFVVLLSQWTKETTNQVLIMLTVTDFVFLLAFVIPRLECIVRRFDPLLAYNLLIIRSWVPLYHLGRVSVMLVCVLGVERYIVVLHPLKAATIITKRRVQVVCLVLTVLVFAAASPLFMFFQAGQDFSVTHNGTVIQPIPRMFIMENIQFIKNYFLALSILLRYVPVFIVMFCTGAILRALRHGRDWRKGSAGQADNNKDVEQRKITKTLLGVCILLIICSFPGLLYELVSSLFSGLATVGRYRNLHSVVSSVTFLFEVVNSSLNFVLYITTSRRFMATWRRLFCPCWNTRGPHHAHSTVYSTGKPDVSKATASEGLQE